MGERTGRIVMALVVVGLAAPALAGDRPADAIVAEIEAISRPVPAQVREMAARRAALVDELRKSHPDDPRLATYLPQRWVSLGQAGRQDEALREIDAALGSTKDEAFRKDALDAKVKVLLSRGFAGIPQAVPVVEEFVRLAPDDGRSARLLYDVSSKLRPGDPKRDELEARLLASFPDHVMAKRVAGRRKQAATIGQAFDLEFVDAIGGATVSTRRLRGKVIVVVFWATWSDACVQQMPRLKALRAKYKEKGVEFLGVSLDHRVRDGGLDKLRGFVAAEGIDWPQSYRDNEENHELARSWGVGRYPTYFLIDADGKLVDTEVYNKLEAAIVEQLGRAGSRRDGP